MTEFFVARRAALEPMSFLIAAAVVLIPLATWLYSLGDPIAYLRNTLPPGQSLYLLSKVLGLYALLALTMQLGLGMRMAHEGEKASPRRFNHHRVLGAICLLLILGHLGLFVGAVSVRNHHFASDYLIPTLSHGFYRTMISIGVVAFTLLLIATLSRAVRRHFPRASTALHRLAPVAYALVIVHSLAIGSESRMGLMPAFYAASAAFVLLSVIRRVRAWQASRSLASPPGPLPSSTSR